MKRKAGRFLSFIALCMGVCPFGFSQVTGEETAPTTAASFLSKTLFLPRYSYASGKENWDIAGGDMDKDGFIDLVTVSKNEGKIRIQYNSGTGAFDDNVAFGAPLQSRSLCLFDANGDTWLDVGVISLIGEIGVLLNDGTGGLKEPFLLETETAGNDIAATDFNRDGKMDLVVTLTSDNTLLTLLGDGAGVFTKYKTIETGNKPRSLVCGDFTGDAIPDIAVGCDDGNLYVYANNGKGIFGEIAILRASVDNWGLAAGDLDADGTLDLVSSSYTDPQACIFTNKGGAKFNPAQKPVIGDHNFAIEIGDMNRDGNPDLVTCSSTDNQIYLVPNEGKAIFGTARPFLSGYWNSALVLADMDNDGDLDVASSSMNDSKVNFHRNTSVEKTPAAAARYIKGKVMNLDNNAPANNLPLTLVSSKGQTISTTMTNENGEYMLANAGEDIYTIVARSGQVTLYPCAIQASGMADTEHNMSLSTKEFAFMEGAISASRSGKGVAHALVRIIDSKGAVMAQTSTSKNGCYRFTVRIGENVTQYITHQWYKPYQSTFDVVAAAGAAMKVNAAMMDNDQMATVEGKVTDALNKAPITGAAIVLCDAQGRELARSVANEMGHYTLSVPVGSYKLLVSPHGFFYASSVFDLTQESLRLKHDHNFALRPLDAGQTIILNGVYFRAGDGRLEEASFRALQQVFHVLDDNAELLVEIAGHTDGDGVDAVNLRLSQARAQSVVSYLAQLGISPQRMLAKGYGETKPVAANDTPANKAQNNRIELTIVGALQTANGE